MKDFLEEKESGLILYFSSIKKTIKSMILSGDLSKLKGSKDSTNALLPVL